MQTPDEHCRNRHYRSIADIGAKRSERPQAALPRHSCHAQHVARPGHEGRRADLSCAAALNSSGKALSDGGVWGLAVVQAYGWG